jgi:hypothetical protein
MAEDIRLLKVNMVNIVFLDLNRLVFLSDTLLLNSIGIFTAHILNDMSKSTIFFLSSALAVV